MTTRPKIDMFPLAEAATHAALSMKSLGDGAARMARTMNDWIAEQAALRVCGLRVQVAPHILPGPTPSAAEDARRIVRHGMRDVLKWLGEDVGPRPGERTHAVVMSKDGTLWVSPELWERLQVEAPPTFAPVGEPLRSDVYEPVFRARNLAEFRQMAVQPVSGIRVTGATL